MGLLSIVKSDPVLALIVSAFTNLKSRHDLDNLFTHYTDKRKNANIHCRADELIYRVLESCNRLLFYDIVIDKIRSLYTDKRQLLYSMFELGNICLDMYKCMFETFSDKSNTSDVNVLQRNVISLLVKIVKLFGASIATHLQDFRQLLNTNIDHLRTDLAHKHLQVLAFNREHRASLENNLRQLLVHPQTINIIFQLLESDKFDNTTNLKQIAKDLELYCQRTGNVVLQQELESLLTVENLPYIRFASQMTATLLMLTTSAITHGNTNVVTDVDHLLPHVHLLVSLMLVNLSDRIRCLVREVVEIFYMILSEKYNFVTNDIAEIDELEKLTIKKIKLFKRQCAVTRSKMRTRSSTKKNDITALSRSQKK